MNGGMYLTCGDSSEISKQDVKSMIINVVLVADRDSNHDGFPDDGYQHANVEVRNENVKVRVEETSIGSLDVYNNHLGDSILEISSFSDEKRIGLLRHITAGVRRLHQMDKPHGDIVPSNVFISKDERNHPFLCISEANNNYISITDDVKDLGELFYFVLSHGNRYEKGHTWEQLELSEKHTAWDLISKMLCNGGEPFTCDDILRHPMFWSEGKKVNYVVDMYDSVSHSRNSLVEIEDDAREKVFKGEWKEKLKLSPEEKWNYETNENYEDGFDMDAIYRQAGGKKTKKKNVSCSVKALVGKKVKIIDKLDEKSWNRTMKKIRECNPSKDEIVDALRDEICNKMHDVSEEEKEKDTEKHVANHEIFSSIILCKTTEDGGYNEHSFYDLLRFIRNKKAHLFELDEIAKVCFRAGGGFWKYFATRYPMLLTYLYNNRGHFVLYKEI